MLAICCSSLLIVGLDATAVNVALPTIGRELSASISGLQWTVDAYTVAIASLLMLAGSMGDRFGRRRTFVTGLAVFTVGSLACSVAPSIELLVAARVLQAIGGSMLNPVAMSIVTNTFTDPRERAQAVGLWGAVFGLSMALGPVVGGLLVDAASWRAIFWLNVPVGLAAIVLALRVIPESKAPVARRFDPVGQLLVSLMLITLTFSIIEAPGHGWTSPLILAGFAVAVGSLAGLVAYEPRRTDPLIDLRFFRSIPFASSVGLAVAAFATFGGFLFLNTLYLQGVRGLSPVNAGLSVLPMAVVIAIASPIAGRVVGHRGPRLPLLLAGAGMIVGALALIGLDRSTPMLHIALAYAAFGLGFGCVNAPITNAAVSGMPRAQAGVAAAITSTSRQVGMTLGVAIAGAIVSSRAAAEGTGQNAAVLDHAAWWVLVGTATLVLGLGRIATSRRALASAQRTAEALNPEALAGYATPAPTPTAAAAGYGAPR